MFQIKLLKLGKIALAKFKLVPFTSIVGLRGNSILKVVDFYMGIPILLVISQLRRKKTLPSNPKKIGVMVLSAIGDTILSSSILASIKVAHPEVELIVFCTANNSGVFKLLKGCDQIIVLPIMNPFKSYKLIRKNLVDVLIDTSQWPRLPALFSSMSRAFTIGFNTDGQFRHYAYDIFIRHSSNHHEIHNFYKLLNSIDINEKSLPTINNNALDALSMPSFEGKNYIIFHPWAGGTQYQMREWPSDNWVELGKFLIDLGFQILITGGADDVEKTEKLIEYIGDYCAVTSAAGKFNLTQTAKLIKLSKGVVCVNTGIMHLASALDVPLVALHGPTNVKRWGPIGSQSRVVAVSLENGGQFLNLGFEYPKYSKYIMDKISVQDVVNSLASFLDLNKSKE